MLIIDSLQKHGFVILLGAITIVSALPRFLYPGLYAEDALIFFADAQRFGVWSLTKPYAGYLCAIPRIFALIAYPLAPQFQPWAYATFATLATWLVSVVTFLVFGGSVSQWKALTAGIAILLVPSRGEVSYVLTNVQWQISVVLVLALLNTHSSRPRSRLGISIGLLLIGLTGPFSAILLPALWLRWIAYRDFKVKWYLYLPFVVSALVQIVVFVLTPRQPYGTGSTAALADFLLAIFVNYPSHFFGPRVVGSISAIWFWTSCLVVTPSIFAALRYREVAAPTIIFFVAASLITSAAIFAYKAAPLTLSPNATLYSSVHLEGERYFYIPTLMLVFALLWTNPTPRLVAKASTVSVALLLFVGLTMAWKMPIRDFQWRAYTVLAGKIADVRIPVYPDWTLDSLRAAPLSVRNIDLSKLSMKGVKTERGSGQFIASDSDPQFDLGEFPECDNQNFIALKVDHGRAEAPQVFLGLDNQPFSESQSIVLRALDDSPYFFAFTKGVATRARLRFDPTNHAGAFSIGDIHILCY